MASKRTVNQCYVGEELVDGKNYCIFRNSYSRNSARPIKLIYGKREGDLKKLLNSFDINLDKNFYIFNITYTTNELKEKIMKSITIYEGETQKRLEAIYGL